MKRFSFGLFLGTLMSFIAVIGAFAADITNAIYRADIVVTNNGTATNNQSAVFTLNTSQLINQNFVNSALNNTALINNAGGDNPFMPGAKGDQPWVVWVSSIGGAITNSPYVLYLGGNQSMNSNIAYFPGAEGMNTTDNASMELGANFTINQTGYIDTSAGANKYLVNKPGAFVTNISAAGSITSWLVSPTPPTSISLNLSPNGAGVITDIPAVFGAATHWQAVDESPSTPDDNTTYVYNAIAGFRADAYALPDFPLDDAVIETVSVTIRVAVNNTNAMDTYGIVYLGGANTTSAAHSAPDTMAWTTFTDSLTRPGGGSWTVADINSLQAGVGLTGIGGANEVRCTLVYVTVVYHLSPPVGVTATGISSGNHTVITMADSSNLSIYVDGVLKQTASLNGSSINNTANDYQFFTANATPYIQRHQISINGTLQQDVRWQYNSATPYVFTDASLHGHSAVPTFRTAGTSVNVTANMTTFEPISQSTATVTNPSIASYNLTSNFTQPAGLYTELNITFPGAAVLNELLDGASIPRAIIWFPLIFGFINLAGLGMYALTKSVMVEALVVGFLIMLASLMGGFGYWVVIEYIILALAIILADKQYGW